MVRLRRQYLLRRKEMTNAAMWLAGIFGPLFVIIGLWKLLYAGQWAKVLTTIKGNVGLMYYSSVVYLWVGLTVLSQYDMWGWNVLTFVTLIGWVLIIRGVLGLFLPQLLLDIFMGNPTMMKSWGLIPLIWGIILCWLAFFS